MADERLLTISTFARTVGIPASALRHYASQRVLEPADVDPVSGYRYYSTSQIDSGVLLQRMRSAAVPLPVMREVLAGTPREGALRLAELATHHGRTSRRREDELVALRSHLDPARADHVSAQATLLVTVLASAFFQVLRAAANAATDISGLVCSVGAQRVELISTDRYWLAHRRLGANTSGDAVRAIISTEDAADVAAECARHGTIHFALTEQELTIRSTEGSLVARIATVERTVPDLGLLVSTQPPARVLAWFPRSELRTVFDHTGQKEKLLVVSGEGTSTLHAGDSRSAPPILHGSATSGEKVEVLMGRRLLSAAVATCPGDDVMLTLVDTTTPVRVSSPDQENLTCLVMPMLP